MSYNLVFIFFVSALCALSTSMQVGQSSKIINGILASDGDIPYVAAVMSPSTNTCASAILSEKWVLTVASCCAQLPLSKSSVYYGSVLLDGDGTNLTIIQKITHPEYKPENAENDLCLLQVEDDIIFSENVKPISLPTSGEALSLGAEVITAGWGNTIQYADYIGSNQLKIIPKSVVIDQPSCFNITLVQTNFTGNGCAFASKNADACIGDLGGPVVSNGTLYGSINLIRERFCGSGFPYFYVNVPYYIDWINEIISSETK